MNQLLKTVDTMRNDVHQINTRINILERSLTEVKNHQLRKKVNRLICNKQTTYELMTRNLFSYMQQIMELKHPKWWPFTEISPTWFFFMIVWPFLAQRLMNTMQRKKWPQTNQNDKYHKSHGGGVEIASKSVERYTNKNNNKIENEQNKENYIILNCRYIVGDIQLVHISNLA